MSGESSRKVIESTFEKRAISLQEFGESLVDFSGALCADFADIAFFAILEALSAGNAVVDIVVLKNIIKNDDMEAFFLPGYWFCQ